MVRRVASNGARASCAIGELDAAADRGAVGERARRFQQLVAELARRAGAVDHGPVDHDLLRADAGPFDEADRDLPVRPGADRVEHPRVGDRRRVALALQQEFGMVDAARHVGGQHQQQVDLLGGARPAADKRQRQQRQRRHGRSRVMSAPPTDASRKPSRFRMRPMAAAADSRSRADGLQPHGYASTPPAPASPGRRSRPACRRSPRS